MAHIAEVIKYEGDNSTFIWKHPSEDFNNLTQLIVHESQEAIFFMNGQALDLFGPGRYTLETQNIPKIGKALNRTTGGETPFHCEVYFINKTVQMAVKWGTDSKVRFIEPNFGVPVEIGASGEMNLMVSDPRKLLIKVVGTTNGIAWDDRSGGFTKSLAASFLPLISTAVKTNLSACIKANNINILEVDESLELNDYKDSKKLADTCYEKAEIARKDTILNEAERKKNTGDINGRDAAIKSYEEAIKIYESISGWKNSEEQIKYCKDKIEDIKKKLEEERLERERKEEIARKNAIRNKKIAKIVTPIVCAIVIFVIVLNNVIIPNNRYNEALELMKAEKYEEACRIFYKLDNYKDSGKQLEKIKSDNPEIAYKFPVIGEYVKFGKYEQDNNSSNGQEEIEWLVLEKDNNKALLISKYALDCKEYNTEYERVTWETYTLRTWLNNEFINTAFTDSEKSIIPTVTVSADANPVYDTNPGNATQDKVFLLSINEVNKYFKTDTDSQCKVTEYAVNNGADTSSDNCWWWLRSPGNNQNNAANVNTDGSVNENGNNVNNDNNAVRPALLSYII